MKQAKIHIQEVEDYGKYIERRILIAYFGRFLLQDLLYREVGQANQHQDQKQWDSGVMFLKSLTTTPFYGALVLLWHSTNGSERPKSVEGAVSDKSRVQTLKTFSFRHFALFLCSMAAGLKRELLIHVRRQPSQKPSASIITFLSLYGTFE